MKAVNKLGETVIVIGGGIAGLSTVAALAAHFNQVILLERDSLMDSVQPRRSVGQYHQLHCLLHGGYQALAALFPGLDTDLVNAGAVPIDYGQDYQLEFAEKPWIHVPSELKSYSMSRRLLENVLRRRIASLLNVDFRENVLCKGFILDSPSNTILGIYAKSGDMDVQLEADLVVDASGSTSLSKGLMNSLGLPPLEVSEIAVDISYATARFVGPLIADNWAAAVTASQQPGDLTGMLAPIEGNSHQVTVVFPHGRRPSKDEAAFRAALQELRTPTIANSLASAELVSGIERYHFPRSIWLHWERAPRMPRRYLPIGDAYCRFNPVYGQGMSIGAIGAVAIQDIAQKEADLDNLVHKYLARLQPVLSDVWAAAAFKDAPGSLPEHARDVAGRHRELLRLAGEDREASKLLMQVIHLLRPAADLMSVDIDKLVKPN